jgi:hypothetical protein
MSKDDAAFPATNRSAATSSLVRQKMAMFEKMAATGGGSSNGEEEEDMPRPPKLGNLVKSRHEWIMKQQSKGYSSPDPLATSVAKASDSMSGGGSECRNDHVKLVTKNVHHSGSSDDERDGASNEAASSEPDPIFLGSAEEEPPAVDMEAAPAPEAATEAPVPEICFGGRDDNADDSSAVNPMDVSVLGGFEAAEEAPAAVACVVKHNRSFTRVTVIGSTPSRGNTPVMMNQESAAASAAGSKSSSAAPTAEAASAEIIPTTPPTIAEALFEDNDAEVEEGKECDSMINEFDLVRVDSTYHGTASTINWCSETLLITEDEWEAVPKIDKDAVWRETKKPIKWCLDTLLIDNTL